MLGEEEEKVSGGRGSSCGGMDTSLLVAMKESRRSDLTPTHENELDDLYHHHITSHYVLVKG